VQKRCRGGVGSPEPPGVMHLFEPYVRREVASGALERVLAEHALDPVPIYALYPQQGLVPPKVRVFLDYLVDLFAGKARARRAEGRPREGCRRSSEACSLTTLTRRGFTARCKRSTAARALATLTRRGSSPRVARARGKAPARLR
jgi:hypothetical protein